MRTIDTTQRDALLRKLAAAKDELIGAYNEANQVIDEHVGEATKKYNAVLEEIASWRDDQVTQMQDYFDSRGEKWQEGEKGEAYFQWKDEWETGLDLDRLDAPGEIEVPALDHDEELSKTPETPDDT